MKIKKKMVLARVYAKINKSHIAGSLEESKESLGSRAPLLLFTLQVASLVRQVGAVLSTPLAAPPTATPPPPSSGSTPEPLPGRQREEWAEFFAEGIYSTLLPLFLKVSSGKVSDSCLSFEGS